MSASAGDSWAGRRLIAYDETPLFYRELTASGARRGTLLVVHGMGEHGGRYRHVAAYFRELGYDVLVPDLRGFGESGGGRGQGRLTQFYKDLSAFHYLAFKRNKDRPCVLLGHSFGGLLAASYAAWFAHPRIDGLILSSPLMGLSVKVPFWKHLPALAAARVFPGWSQRNEIDAACLSHDTAFVQEYRSDPKVHPRISAGLYADLVRAAGRRRETARRIRVPVCIVQAGDDRLISKDAVSQFHDELATEDREMTVFDGYYHEVLNEVGREKVFHAISSWIVRHPGL